MDMDIPLPDELEWLEANSNGHEDELNLYSIIPNPHVTEHERKSFLKSSISSIPPSVHVCKRPRFDNFISFNYEDTLHFNEKRTNINVGRPEIDEWLPKFSVQERNSWEQQDKLHEAKILSRYASDIEGGFIPVMAPNGGDRIYAKKCRLAVDRCQQMDSKSRSTGLISESINILLKRLEQEDFDKTLQSSFENLDAAAACETQDGLEQLWVDKYAPNSFTELLSDEQTNREVLQWLKQWDSSVFGSEIRSTSDEVLFALRCHSSGENQGDSDSIFQNSRRGDWKNENKLKLRPTDTPEHKILLLCGPPGLGKTTLAHITAMHCGYKVVEINASDEKSWSTIEAKILSVVQMNSVIADSKPNCLVIDEIDGALGNGRGAVEVILRMVSTEAKLDERKESIVNGEFKMTSSKKLKKSNSLLRPVICICNDLYAPALRPLRQVAKIHIFAQPAINCVVSRLKYVAGKEGMKTSSIALTSLVEYTECDIRSCLNTLQFLNKKQETLNVLDISSQVVGRKDISRSVFQIWKEIFQKRKRKHMRNVDPCGIALREFDILHSLLTNRDDYDVILDGIHENVLRLNYHDPLLKKTVKCFNALGNYDVFHKYVRQTQKMSLLAYFPQFALGVNQLVAQLQNPNIELPKAYRRYQASFSEKNNILKSWLGDIPSSISRHFSVRSLVEDTISLLLHILTPSTIRPAALYFLSEKERNSLSQLIKTMVCYSIIYKVIKPTPFNAIEPAVDISEMSFDPPVFDFINFQGYSSGHNHVVFPWKKILVHEVEKQKILQATTFVQSVISGPETFDIKSLLDSKNECISNDLMMSPTLVLKGGRSCRKNNVPGNQKKKSNHSDGYFDRFKKQSTSLKSSNNEQWMPMGTGKIVHSLLFKFNEGFTNSIKRPVRMREFLL